MPFKAVFQAYTHSAPNTAVNGRELWVWDGTAAPSLLKDITPGTNGSSPSNMMLLNDHTIAFQAAGGLWVTDGTAGGTSLIFSNGFQQLTNLGNGNAIFRHDENGASQLWITDGTAAGTSLFKTGLAGLYNISNAGNGKAGFAAVPTSDSGVGREPWITDGTEAGTFLLKNIVLNSVSVRVRDPFFGYTTRTYGPDSNPSNFFGLTNDKILFIAREDPTNSGPNQLWVTDGTSAGTSKLAPLGLSG
jgi:ELWxxDGT repeat protein